MGRRSAWVFLGLAVAAWAEQLPPGADLRLGFIGGYLQDSVRRIRFSPDGERFLAAGWRRAAFFATEDGAPRGALKVAAGAQLEDVQLVDGGQTVLAVNGTRAVLLQPGTSWEHGAFGGDDMFADVARSSPDDKLVAVGGRRRKPSEDERATLVRVFVRETGQLVHELEMAGRGVEDLAFAPAGNALAVASGDAYLRVFDLTTGEEAQRFGGRALEPAMVETEADRLDTSRVLLEFLGVAFSPGGGEVVGVTRRHSLSLWRRSDGALLTKIEAAAPGEGEGAAARLPRARRRVGMTFFAASPDGVRAVVYSQDLKLVNLSSGETERTLDFPAGVPGAAAFTPDGRSVVVGGTRGLCFRYDVESGDLVGRGREVRGAVVTLAPRPRVHEVLAGDFRFLRRWGLGDGLPVGRPMEHGAPVDVLAASPDGSRALTAGGPPGAKVWTLGSDLLEVTPELAGDEVAGARFLAPARLLIVGRSGVARVFDLPASAAVEEFSTGSGAALAAFDAEGRRMAVLGSDHLRIFDLQDRRELTRFPVPVGVVAKSLAVAPDGSSVALGLKQRDQVLRFDANGAQLAPLLLRKEGEVIPTRHRDDTRAGSWEVVYTLDGKRLVARSAGRALQVWSHSDGRRVGHVEASVLNEVTGLCLAPSGAKVISAAGKVAYRWKLEAAR